MTEQSDTETRLGPASAYAASEKELIWRHADAAAAMNFHAQSYDFDQPRCGGFDAGNAVTRCMEDRRIADLDMLARVETAERLLEQRDPFAARVLRDAYTPRSWPDFLRSKMALTGDRGEWTLLGLLPLSFLAVGIRDRHRPPNDKAPRGTLADFWNDFAGQPGNEKTIARVRDDLELIQRHALAAYHAIRQTQRPYDEALKAQRRRERNDRRTAYDDREFAKLAVFQRAA